MHHHRASLPPWCLATPSPESHLQPNTGVSCTLRHLANLPKPYPIAHSNPLCPSPTPFSCRPHLSHPALLPPSHTSWVREELHRWVYDNVRAKWTFVLRKPSRLPELFSGYHASRALVAEVLSRWVRVGGCGWVGAGGWVRVGGWLVGSGLRRVRGSGLLVVMVLRSEGRGGAAVASKLPHRQAARPRG